MWWKSGRKQRESSNTSMSKSKIPASPAGGQNPNHKTIIRSPLGNIKITCDEGHLLGIEFTNAKPNTLNHPMLKKTAKQLKEYFAGKRNRFDIPVKFQNATPFQRRVWQELAKIPHGQTISYKELAKRINRPKACRAVGNANGRNPIPIIIPCHRAIASNDKLGGFSSGLWRKKKLLQLEGVVITS